MILLAIVVGVMNHYGGSIYCLLARKRLLAKQEWYDLFSYLREHQQEGLELNNPDVIKEWRQLRTMAYWVDWQYQALWGPLDFKDSCECFTLVILAKLQGVWK